MIMRTASGRLNRGNIPFSMGSLYPEPPIEYRDLTAIAVKYETDFDMARDVVPEPLEVMDPAIVVVSVQHIGRSCMGGYSEATMTMPVLWHGKPRRYVVMVLVTGDIAMALGRELLGNPKKFAHVELKEGPEGMTGIVERPKGVRLFTSSVVLERPVTPDPDMLRRSPPRCPCASYRSLRATTSRFL